MGAPWVPVLCRTSDLHHYDHKQGNANVTGKGKTVFVPRSLPLKPLPPTPQAPHRARYRELRRRTEVLATAWDFLEGRAQAIQQQQQSEASDSTTTKVAVFNTTSTRRPNLANPRVRGRLQAWVPERFLQAAEVVQSSMPQQPHEAVSPDPPTLYVGGGVDVCRVCHVDSVSEEREGRRKARRWLWRHKKHYA
jgi:hypothetical protein